MIDSPVLPDELDALPALLEQAGFPAPSGLLATHGDWDHLLGRLAFPGVALGRRREHRRAPEGLARRRPSASCGTSTKSLLIERARPLALGSVQALPVPGRCDRRRPRARAACRRGPHRRRHGGADPVGARARRRRLPVADRAAHAQRRRRRSRPISPRSSACAPWSPRPSTSCPATDRCSAASRGARESSRRTSAYLQALRRARQPRPSCRPAGARSAQRRIHARERRGALSVSLLRVALDRRDRRARPGSARPR